MKLKVTMKHTKNRIFQPEYKEQNWNRPTDIDTVKENNSYRMLTQQRPENGWKNHGFCA